LSLWGLVLRRGPGPGLRVTLVNDIFINSPIEMSRYFSYILMYTIKIIVAYKDDEN
jgi:hypothetical protein